MIVLSSGDLVNMLLSKIPPAWQARLEPFWKRDEGVKLDAFVTNAYASETVYPPEEDLFTALKLTPPQKVRAVILGQDPYHGANEAHGLSFSVRSGIRFPPSLRNIFKELKNDLNLDPPDSGDLSRWAEQGVLLLNAVLTVRADAAGSHAKRGWEAFTDFLIAGIAQENPEAVFVLWGNFAQSKKVLLPPAASVIESVHPSPLSASRGFFGSRPFSKINEALARRGLPPIDWTLDTGRLL